jgi:hypothetical protein
MNISTAASTVNADEISMEAIEAMIDDPAPSVDVEATSDIVEASIESIDADVEEAALAGAEQSSTIKALYEEADSAAPEVSAGDTPKTDSEATPPVEPVKAKKAKAPKVVKAPVPTFHSHSKSGVLLHKLGGVRDVLNTEVGDFSLDPADQLVKQDALLAVLDGDAAKKVGEKAIMLLTGKAATQEVLKRTFTVLARDGFLSSGDKGNLVVDLLAKPYSIGTARSQSNQMFALLPMLNIATKASKGVFVPNANSTVLANTLAVLGLTLAPTPAIAGVPSVA